MTAGKKLEPGFMEGAAYLTIPINGSPPFQIKQKEECKSNLNNDQDTDQDNDEMLSASILEKVTGLRTINQTMILETGVPSDIRPNHSASKSDETESAREADNNRDDVTNPESRETYHANEEVASSEQTSIEINIAKLSKSGLYSACENDNGEVTRPELTSAEVDILELSTLGLYSPPYKATVHPFPVVQQIKPGGSIPRSYLVIGLISFLINPLIGIVALILLSISSALGTSDGKIQHSKRLRTASFLTGLLGICCTLVALGVYLVLRFVNRI